MISNGISVVPVNPYAVKQTKEIEDNSQLKDDTKDPKLIANFVKDGNYGMPYLSEKLRRIFEGYPCSVISYVKTESAKEDAVADCNCLQVTTSDLYDTEKGNDL